MSWFQIRSKSQLFIFPFQEMKELRDLIISPAYHRNHNCFMLCVIAHGDGENIYTQNNWMYDSGTVEGGVWTGSEPAWNIQEIQDDLDDVRSLLSKPKLLLLDFCRGSELWIFCRACFFNSRATYLLTTASACGFVWLLVDTFIVSTSDNRWLWFKSKVPIIHTTWGLSFNYFLVVLACFTTFVCGFVCF